MFVTQIASQLISKLKQLLEEQEFEFSQPLHTEFSAKKKGISCTLYKSGKLVVQGKESAEFIEFHLEPHVLSSFEYTLKTQTALSSTTPLLPPHIGIDESGKGDFFGPLCVAGVYASSEQIGLLLAAGVKDSKLLSDEAIYKIGPKIQKICIHHIIKINPAKYNEIYASFKNLNKLLGWGHATAIENLVEESKCLQVTIDQFADESVVITALKRKGLSLDLTQRHKGEEDPVVAAASILARYAFLEGLKKLGAKYNMNLPKGASPSVIKAGRQLFRQFGYEGLKNCGKLHFKTLDEILKNG